MDTFLNQLLSCSGKRSQTEAEYERVLQKVFSVQMQGTHVGGLRHCVDLVNKHLRNTRAEIEQENEIKQLFLVIERISTEISEYVFKNGGDYYYDDLTEDTHRDRWPDIETISTQLQKYIKQRNKIFQRPFYDGTNDFTYATTALLSHLLQTLCEEILLASAGSCNIEDTLKKSLSQTKNWTNAKINIGSKTKIEEISSNSDSSRDTPANKRTIISNFQREDVKYGLRVGIGAFILCMPAYIRQSHEWFHTWHGEWSVNVYMIVMVKCMGGMWSDFSLRLIGSTSGAALGLITTILWIEHTAILFVFTFVMSMICFKKILGDRSPSFGRFVLMSYTLITLFCYRLELESPLRGEKVIDITFHRIIAVTVGVIWSAIFTNMLFPISAEQSLKDNLGIQWMRLGMEWKEKTLLVQNGANHSSRVVIGKSQSVQDLQNTMLVMRSLYARCQDEIRLNDEFRHQLYRELLESTEKIVESIHCLSILLDDVRPDDDNENIIHSTVKERYRICQNVFLNFYIMSTSIRLGVSSPDYDTLEQSIQTYMPNAEDYVIPQESLRDYQNIKNYSYPTDLFYLYSFIAVANSIIEEMRNIHHDLNEIVGNVT